MNMTLRRLAALHVRTLRPTATHADTAQLAMAHDQRRHERGPSKLARRMTRKVQLGLSGAF